MTIRRKVAAGLGGLTLMLGTITGVAAVHAATPAPAPASAPAASATATVDNQADGETADDTTTSGMTEPTGPDTDNVQDGPGQQDRGPDTTPAPGATTSA